MPAQVFRLFWLEQHLYLTTSRRGLALGSLSININGSVLDEMVQKSSGTSCRHWKLYDTVLPHRQNGCLQFFIVSGPRAPNCDDEFVANTLRVKMDGEFDEGVPTGHVRVLNDRIRPEESKSTTGRHRKTLMATLAMIQET